MNKIVTENPPLSVDEIVSKLSHIYATCCSPSEDGKEFFVGRDDYEIVVSRKEALWLCVGQ